MITVILPTLWLGEHILYMLPELQKCETVGEIIIIDNDKSRTPDVIHTYSKVRHYPMESNIYVVKAWNYGVKLSRFDKLLFLNDDVCFDTKILDCFDEAATELVGMVTFDADYVQFDTTYHEAPKYAGARVSACPKLRNGAAIMFSIHKKSYSRIPEVLSIHYSDCFLFLSCSKAGKPNMKVSGTFVRTIMSTSTRHFSAVTINDHITWYSVVKQFNLHE